MKFIKILSVPALASLCAFAQQPQTAPAPAPPSPPQVLQWSVPAGGSYLGVHASDIDADRVRELKLKEERGVEIMSVEPDSPAEKAGLQKGDAVLEFNGQRVEGTEQFVRMVRETPPGRTVKLGVSRAGSMQTLNATIGRRKAKAPLQLQEQLSRLREMPQVWIPDIPRAFTSWKSSMLGIEAEGLAGQLAQFFGVNEGVLVRSVAEKAGLKAGDVIVKVAGENVDSPRDVSNQIRAQRPKKNFPLTVVRERKEIAVSVTLDDEDQGRRSTRREEREE
jgi:serine protease Do